MLNLKKGDKAIIDEFIKKHRYESRNIFIRDAIFEKIKNSDAVLEDGTKVKDM